LTGNVFCEGAIDVEEVQSADIGSKAVASDGVQFPSQLSTHPKHVMCLGLILRRASDFGDLWPIRKFTTDSEVYVMSLMCSFFFFSRRIKTCGGREGTPR
jgi:hypothetical protein